MNENTKPQILNGKVQKEFIVLTCSAPLLVNTTLSGHDKGNNSETLDDD